MKKIQYYVQRKSFIDEDMETGDFLIQGRIDKALDLLMYNLKNFKKNMEQIKVFMIGWNMKKNGKEFKRTKLI